MASAPIKWVGSKRRSLPFIESRVPKSFTRYWEPFMGSAALFFRLQPSTATLQDLNEDLINCYQVIRDNPDGLLESLEQHQNDPSYFQRWRALDRSPIFGYLSKTQRASRFIYLNKTCFNGVYRVNQDGKFNVPFGRYKAPAIVNQDLILGASKALQNADLKWEPYTTLETRVKPGDFCYFDPPYLPLSDSSNFTQYTREMFLFQQHIELRDLLDRLDQQGIAWMLSNSSAPESLELYRRYRIEWVQVGRSVSCKKDNRKPVNEILVRNF